MTDHRPEVREALEKALYCIEVQNMHSYDEQPDVETAIANGYWCKMAMDARSTIKAALSAPPIEPVGMRGAIDKALREVASDLDNRWCRNAHIILTAALAACEQPVVDEVVEVRYDSFGRKLIQIIFGKQVNEGDRLRIVGWKVK